MALFWIVKPKPKLGFEPRYQEIKKEIEIIVDQIENSNLSQEETCILNSKLNELVQEIEDNTISKYTTAQTPKLGTSKETDQLILHKYYLTHPYHKIKTIKEFYNENSNKYYCDFSIGDSIGYTGSTGKSELDFRAGIIANSHYLSTEVRILAQQNLTTSMMSILSNMIENEIVNMPNSYYKNNLAKAIKWLRFWSDSGHNICAYID